ncbi:MAG: group II intron reverse transcriptase domain-containing protein [Candidatus Vogelbacteria bacterium]|nr:group II intron reverse transcriptase domain-containing protein [Candidatus Vogelbacteria bacterium]
MRNILSHNFKDIISIENLLKAWGEFLPGKKNKRDVLIFSSHLMDNIISLHRELANHSYKHGGYQAFNISDPKPRNIHKATVRDRLLHHAIYRQLYPFFDKTFIPDSYSCRLRKGTFKALDRFRKFSNKVSNNNRKTSWILKCDIRKFFANIDHQTLVDILKEYISDDETLWLLQEVIGSFHSTQEGVGLPLGNLTSQLLVNVYMNKFDQFMKHKVKAKYYIRYADDFVIMSQDRKWLEEVLLKIKEFLHTNLKLELHPNKVSIETLSSGVDFLGWVNFPDHRVLRTTTEKRMFRTIKHKEGKPEVVQSYLGLLNHGNARKLARQINESLLHSHL